MLTYIDFGFAPDACVLAPRAEQLGFGRYWIGEHHVTQTGNPLLLASQLAARTSAIRLGSAGVCLSFHSPLVVAEDALLLSSLNPNRIDLGVCNCGTSSGRFYEPMVRAVIDGRAMPPVPPFAERVELLSRLLFGQLPDNHPLSPHSPSTVYFRPPELWVLGLGERTAELAASVGANFCTSEHHDVPTGFDGPGLIRLYKDRCVELGRVPGATAVMLSGFCLDTVGEAELLGAQANVLADSHRCIGDSSTWRDYLREMMTRYPGSEIGALDCFFTIRRTPKTVAMRLRMLELLASAFEAASS